jgi:hypothetical protein
MDTKIKVVAFSAVALLGSCTCGEKPKTGGQKQQQPVARLARQRGKVEYRPQRSLTWRNARGGMDLYNRDALKTGKQSTAQVTFKGGGKLNIEEQSLVIIEAPAAKPGAKPGTPRQVARIERGTLRGTVKAGGPALRVVTASGKSVDIKTDGARDVPYRVRVREGGKLEVAVLKGAAKVESEGQEVKLEANQVVDISPEGPRKPVKLPPYPALEAPPVDGELEAGDPVLLRWQPVEAASRYRVQVSIEMSFGRRLVDKWVEEPKVGLPAPKAGRTYFWRVSSVDAAGREGEFGFARRFDVMPPKPAEKNLLEPPDRARFVYVKKPDPIVFRWKGEAPMYLLVVSRDPDLREPVTKRRSKQPRAVVRGLQTGRYFWGVYAIKGKKRTPLFSRPYRLVSAQRTPPGVIVPRSIGW